MVFNEIPEALSTNWLQHHYVSTNEGKDTIVCKSNSVNCWLYLYIGDPCARGGSHATKANRETSAALHREALLHLHATPHGQPDLETRMHVCGLIRRILFLHNQGNGTHSKTGGKPNPLPGAQNRACPIGMPSRAANNESIVRGK